MRTDKDAIKLTARKAFGAITFLMKQIIWLIICLLEINFFGKREFFSEEVL